MTKLSVVLLALVVLSAFALVRSSYDTRRLFAQLHLAEREAERLGGEARRLEAEREAQATSLRVERTASDKLGMRGVNPAVTVTVIDPAYGAASAPGAVP